MKFSAIVLVTLAAFATTASGAAIADCQDADGDTVGKMKACLEYIYGSPLSTTMPNLDDWQGAGETDARKTSVCDMGKAYVSCAKSVSTKCLVKGAEGCVALSGMVVAAGGTCDADCSGAFSIKTGILATTALALLTSVVGLSL